MHTSGCDQDRLARAVERALFGRETWVRFGMVGFDFRWAYAWNVAEGFGDDAGHCVDGALGRFGVGHFDGVFDLGYLSLWEIFWMWVWM